MLLKFLALGYPYDRREWVAMKLNSYPDSHVVPYGVWIPFMHKHAMISLLGLNNVDCKACGLIVGTFDYACNFECWVKLRIV